MCRRFTVAGRAACDWNLTHTTPRGTDVALGLISTVGPCGEVERGSATARPPTEREGSHLWRSCERQMRGYACAALRWGKLEMFANLFRFFRLGGRPQQAAQHCSKGKQIAPGAKQRRRPSSRYDQRRPGAARGVPRRMVQGFDLHTTLPLRAVHASSSPAAAAPPPAPLPLIPSPTRLRTPWK